MTDPSDIYDHRVAHIETIKVVNNRYSTPVTLKFAAVTKERTVNIAQKNVIIFAAINFSTRPQPSNLQKVLFIITPKIFYAAKHIKMLLKLSLIGILTSKYHRIYPPD